MKLALVEDGIFPILRDENNQLIGNKLETGFKVGGTLQGEGKFVNVPSLFLRVTGCNLRCIFTSNGIPNTCDTAYSSFTPDQIVLELEQVEKIIRNNIGKIHHLVITGGEPQLQSAPLVELLKKLKDLELTVTIETNGSICTKLAEVVDLVSISPKLSSSNPTLDKVTQLGLTLNPSWEKVHNKVRYNLDMLQEIMHVAKDFQLKFVITSQDDIDEVIENYLTKLDGWKPSQIYLMPEGMTEAELQAKSMWLIEQCLIYGYTFCPRMHVQYFGGAKRSI